MERTVTLQVDRAAGELHGLRNPLGHTSRAKITAKHLGECKLTGELKAVHYGHFGGKRAALIVFGFTFHFQTSRKLFRYTSASIKITFSSINTDTIDHREPIVQKFFPAAVFGECVKEKLEWKWEVPLLFGTSSLLPVELGVHPKVGQHTTVERGQRAEIHGITFGYPNVQDANVVQWDLSENKAQQDGVPHYFPCAAIVLHERGEFKAEVTVKVSTALSIAGFDPRAWIMNAKPWSKDDPLHFDWSIVPEGVSTLAELRELDLSTLTEDQCKMLTPLPVEYQVCYYSKASN